jgi:hypothetical protein
MILDLIQKQDSKEPVTDAKYETPQIRSAVKKSRFNQPLEEITSGDSMDEKDVDEWSGEDTGQRLRGGMDLPRMRKGESSPIIR